MVGFVEFQGYGLIVDGGEGIDGYSGGTHLGGIRWNMKFPHEYCMGYL